MRGYPFTLFKRKNSPYYYVRFKNEKTGKYFTTQYSTKEKTKAEALKVAIDWLINGIGTTQKKSLQILTIVNLCQTEINTKEEAELILKILQKKGLLKTYVLPDATNDISFIDYLKQYWDWDNSEALKEKRRKEKSIHKTYVYIQNTRIDRYYVSFFKDKALGALTKKDFKNFIDIVLQPLNISFGTKNNILRTARTALKYAYDNEIIQDDIMAGLVFFGGKTKKRDILPPETVRAVFQAKWNDRRAYLANLLAMITGLRVGEVQGLRRKDLGESCIYLRNSWSPIDKLKVPKNTEPRIVVVPRFLIQSLIDLVNNTPHPYSEDNYVFWSTARADNPIDRKLILLELRAALQNIGMSKEESEKYCFHGWRHFYASHMKGKIEDKLLQSQTGHKTLSMLNHYSDHEMQDDFQKIAKAQNDTFGNLLPDVL
ncbi:tyrosine-type recombinase/integrase [Treponema phagedenis]|uniref:tyrosine-type recombinase/integrase n=1 Tax=Treponema phagedenis TaxID=162 RepID=UPI0001F63E80|nr:site-specific integrase [Treponema phagedenis]EFW37906.1 site-specific recombinase, phage integrase family [Treponema phagedenis F0421]TYT79789.1 site-specific integrase [Treponema phagedenis]